MTAPLLAFVLGFFTFGLLVLLVALVGTFITLLKLTTAIKDELEKD